MSGTEYQVTVRLSDGAAQVWRVREGLSCRDAAHLVGLMIRGTVWGEQFFAGKATLRAEPVPRFSEYPFLTVAQWRAIFAKYASKIQWPGR